MTTVPYFEPLDPTSSYPLGKRDEGRDLETEGSSTDFTNPPLVTAHQTSSVLDKQQLRLIQQPTPQTLDRSTTSTTEDSISSIALPIEERVPLVASDTITPVTEVSGPTPAEYPAIPPIERSISPIVEDLVAVPTTVQSLQHPPTPRFFLSSFQRPTLLSTLIQRLQKKRALVHSWRAADEYQAEQGVPPTRPILENLSPSQIFGYIESGGKSIDATPGLTKDKVIPTLLEETVWLTVCV